MVNLNKRATTPELEEKYENSARQAFPENSNSSHFDPTNVFND